MQRWTATCCKGASSTNHITINTDVEFQLALRRDEGGCSSEEIMPKAAFLRAVIKKAGYICGTSIHAVRRYLGKKVGGKLLSSKPLLVSIPFFYS